MAKVTDKAASHRRPIKRGRIDSARLEAETDVVANKGQENPITALAGYFNDDTDWEAMMKQVHKYRRQMDGEVREP